MVSHSSSLPMKASRASLCSRICPTVSAVRVGYRGTVTWPAIQMAMSVIIQWALFLPIRAMWDSGGRFSERRCAAMRRVSAMASRQVYSFTWPFPTGWVNRMVSGMVRSQ